MDDPTLAERLGYGREDRLLIVNCDDVGSSHSANVAAFRAMTYGIATSASLMVPCPWAAEAARMFDGLPLGVHLTLTSEHPGYRWRSLTGTAALRDAAGFLPATTTLAVSQHDGGSVHAECRAQIEAAIAWGVDVTHIDTPWMFSMRVKRCSPSILISPSNLLSRSGSLSKRPFPRVKWQQRGGCCRWTA